MCFSFCDQRAKYSRSQKSAFIMILGRLTLNISRCMIPADLKFINKGGLIDASTFVIRLERSKVQFFAGGGYGRHLLCYFTGRVRLQDLVAPSDFLK